MMAEYFLNCGDFKLEEAARAWAAKHYPQMKQQVSGSLGVSRSYAASRDHGRLRDKASAARVMTRIHTQTNPHSAYKTSRRPHTQTRYAG